eukprot:CAMPEP_0184865376 /NCGR_PEP_ID=MMETSP0580-20130426/17872_1 /TAXON_ID=1118495 /ORGANISM="Dactyliosolen fragilissimus" /LENGTH=427 /DNA_ID=CAMNT_0027364549 /DNA_START=119 /DNA_END=1399 /DNA_ORIENTATION=+
MKQLQCIRGCVIQSVKLGSIEIHKDALIKFDVETGKILEFIHDASARPIDPDAEEIIHLKPLEFIVPGFIDTHIHAPQYAFMGTATDRPLMEWLDKYTFPVEQSFEDLTVATKGYSAVIERALSEGITTAMYFATIHIEASELFADLLEKYGQRGFVGMVSMDRNSPQEYHHSTAKCLELAERLIHYIQSKKSQIVLPVLTPRFIPTCTPELLEGLGQLAQQYDVHVQSHIAESHDEEAFVEQLHPGSRDCELFDKAGLLTRKTCMAHGVHLNSDELQLIQSRGSALAHCPLSNFFFANGVLPLSDILEKKVKVGLGTDVAGGYNISMLSAMRTTVLAHKARLIYEKASCTNTMDIDYKTAFWLATLGGARALELEDKIGSFAIGKSFDALVIDPTAQIDIFPRDTLDDVFQKFINLGDSRNMKSVW